MSGIGPTKDLAPDPQAWARWNECASAQLLTEARLHILAAAHGLLLACSR